MCRVPSRASLLEGIEPECSSTSGDEGENFLEALPADILMERIVPLLSVPARVCLGSTSRQWRRRLFEEAPQLWRKLDLSTCLNARIDDAALLRLTAISEGGLLCLDASGCDVVPATLVAVAQANPHLVVLRGSASVMWTKAQVFQVGTASVVASLLPWFEWHPQIEPRQLEVLTTAGRRHLFQRFSTRSCTACDRTGAAGRGGRWPDAAAGAKVPKTSGPAVPRRRPRFRRIE